MVRRGRIRRLYGGLAGVLLSIFSRRAKNVTAEDLQRAEFKASTQRLGVRFNKKIRDIFRFKWLRKV